ncbi:MAG TPA: TolC family protein, partial [Polyangia bacterium]|nr:TolC family protein [Polyangia bacterium]
MPRRPIAAIPVAVSAALFAAVSAAAFAEPTRLTLDEALRIAETHQPNLEATRAQLAAARARLTQAGAGFLPSLTASFFYQPQTANFAVTPGLKRLLAAPPTTGVFPLGGAGQPQLGVCSTVQANGQPITDPNCARIATSLSLPSDYTLFNFWSAGIGINWIFF